MKVETTSQHLRNAHELFLLVPLKRDFIENTDRLTSPASRLRALLALINGPTQSAVEKTLMPTASSIQVLQNLYSFHYGVVDNLQQPQLILSAVFDSSWETYFHNLVDHVGPFLDAIFCHCQGFEGRSCADGYEAFADFVREHQVQSGIFYDAMPDLTTDDIRILRRVAEAKPLIGPLERLVDEVQKTKPQWVSEMQKVQGQAQFDALLARDLGRFVSAVWEVRKLFPDHAEAPGGRSAQRIFDEAAQVIAVSYFKDATNAVVVQKYLGSQGAHGSFPPEHEARAWLTRLILAGSPARVRPPAPELGPDDLHNIQGNILEAYPRAKEGLLVFMQLPANDGGKLLGALARSLTCADESGDDASARTDQPSRPRINVALTYAGLRRAGLDQGALELFPKEFREGMRQRAGALGDIGWPDHPDYWQPLKRNYPSEEEGVTFSLESVDLLLTLQSGGAPCAEGSSASSEHSLRAALAILLAEIGGEPCVLGVEPLRRGRDHFGFPEVEASQSQPVPRVVLQGRKLHPDSQPTEAGYDNTVALGELLLGYPDDRGEIARCADPRHNATSAKLFVDGTFMVVRKQRQFSKRFHEQLTTSGPKGGVHGILGRDAHGRSLVHSSQGAAPGASEINGLNDFNYEGDKQGARCPLHAHVRRANPRANPRGDLSRPRDPRIMRRSFQYGPDFEKGETQELERGHMFIAFNSSIAEQYEVIQRWVSGGNSTGMLSTTRDPLAGGPLPSTPLVAKDPSGVGGGSSGPVVTLSWGLYLFVPSRDALLYLSDLAPRGTRSTSHEQTRLHELGARRIRELDAIGDPAIARLAWKQLLEEPSYVDDATAVWRVIRESGGMKKTPYGTLVADLGTVRKVLGDDGSKFSVRDYWHRLNATMGEFYLGLDRNAGLQDPAVPEPQREDSRYQASVRTTSYERLASTPNRVLPRSVDKEAPYDAARACTEEFLAMHSERFDLRDLAKVVVGKLSAKWIGIPSAVSSDDELLKEFLQNFIMVSRYCFFPHPAPWLEAEAKERGKALRAAYDRDSLAQGELARLLRAEHYDSPTELRSAVIGANIGFVPPTVAIIVGVLNEWILSGELTLLGRKIAGRSASEATALLMKPLLDIMKESPTFPIIYRRALQGNGLVSPGELVVVSLQSAYIEAEEQGESAPASWLFGGEHGGATSPGLPTHGCPMRDPALQTLAGVIAAVAEVASRAPLVRESFVTFSERPYREPST